MDLIRHCIKKGGILTIKWLLLACLVVKMVRAYLHYILLNICNYNRKKAHTVCWYTIKFVQKRSMSDGSNQVKELEDKHKNNWIQSHQLRHHCDKKQRGRCVTKRKLSVVWDTMSSTQQHKIGCKGWTFLVIYITWIIMSLCEPEIIIIFLNSARKSQARFVRQTATKSDIESCVGSGFSWDIMFET